MAEEYGRRVGSRGPDVLGYAFDPRLLAHDPPPPSLTVAGRPLRAGNRERRERGADRAGARARRAQRPGAGARIRARTRAGGGAAGRPHAPDTWSAFERACAGGPWDGEYAPVTAATWDAARLTVGGVLAAVDAVLDGRVLRARSCTPGRRATTPSPTARSPPPTSTRVACAAEHARARGAERVAIVDWDVHVANGAERIFWDRARRARAVPPPARLVSRPRRARCAPRAARGREGATVNVPLPAATTDAGYALAFDAVVAPVLRAFRPDLILVAAGQDASVLDPTGRMLVSAAGFRALAERLARLADELCDGRLVAATEGGYSPLYNPFCLLAVLEGLAGRRADVGDPWLDDPTVRAAGAPADERVRDALAAVRRAQPRWFG